MVHQRHRAQQELAGSLAASCHSDINKQMPLYLHKGVMNMYSEKAPSILPFSTSCFYPSMRYLDASKKQAHEAWKGEWP